MRIANICPVCATYINAACVIYTGAYLTNIDVSPNDPLDEILGSINDNLVPVVGNGAPAIPAIYIGQLYIDAGTSSIYYAKSIGGGAPDWILLSAGGVTPPPTIVSVLNQALTSNTTTNVGAFSLNFITTNYPTSIFTVQDGQVLIGDSGSTQNGTSIVVDDNLQTVVINGNNGVSIGGDVNNTEIFVDDTNQIINITSGNGVTINGQQIVRSVNGIFADGAGDVALPPFGIDDTLDQNQVFTASRSINVDTHVLEVITANYPGSFLSVQDGIIFFGDSALTVNGTSVMVDDNIQSIMLGTGGIASFQGNNNNTEITMDDGNEIITMVATNWATLNGNNIAVSVNGVFANSSGDVTLSGVSQDLQQVLAVGDSAVDEVINLSSATNDTTALYTHKQVFLEDVVNNRVFAINNNTGNCFLTIENSSNLSQLNIGLGTSDTDPYINISDITANRTLQFSGSSIESTNVPTTNKLTLDIANSDHNNQTLYFPRDGGFLALQDSPTVPYDFTTGLTYAPNVNQNYFLSLKNTGAPGAYVLDLINIFWSNGMTLTIGVEASATPLTVSSSTASAIVGNGTVTNPGLYFIRYYSTTDTFYISNT